MRKSTASSAPAPAPRGYLNPREITALDPNGMNHRQISSHFTRDKLILCAAAALELEHLSCQLFGPMTKAARQEMGGNLAGISHALLQLLHSRHDDADQHRKALADAGVSETALANLYAMNQANPVNH